MWFQALSLLDGSRVKEGKEAEDERAEVSRHECRGGGRGEGSSGFWGGHSVAREEAGFGEGGNLSLEKWLAMQVAAPLPSCRL